MRVDREAPGEHGLLENLRSFPLSHPSLHRLRARPLFLPLLEAPRGVRRWTEEKEIKRNESKGRERDSAAAALQSEAGVIHLV